ncbi:MAG: hypothetical protein H0X36_00400 [Sphingomonadaceae bacterium]|nr:hypothetical protein [Sphingomonadaceae bacterium]
MIRTLAFALLALAACGQPAADKGASENVAPRHEPPAAAPALPASNAADSANWPRAPGTPGGLPDDRTPISEVPIAAESAQGAAQVVERYGWLLEAGDFAKARSLWSDGGLASGLSEAAFAQSWGKYAQVHAMVGAPGRIEGAAGSLHVEVPLQLYGTLKDGGRRFNLIGLVTLRRVNNVPGATPAQLSWHISASGLKPRP